MPPMFYAGFVLMSCVAGAQLSSYASFLSKGDVALSILLTSSTTIASVLATPILTGLLIGSVVPVDAVAMSKSILQVLDNLGKYMVGLCVCVCFFFDKLDCVFLYCSLIGFHYKFNLCTGCSCSNHSRASAKYLCKTCSKRSSTCDATCCNGLHFAMYW